MVDAGAPEVFTGVAAPGPDARPAGPTSEDRVDAAGPAQSAPAVPDEVVPVPGLERLVADLTLSVCAAFCALADVELDPASVTGNPFLPSTCTAAGTATVHAAPGRSGTLDVDLAWDGSSLHFVLDGRPCDPVALRWQLTRLEVRSHAPTP